MVRNMIALKQVEYEGIQIKRFRVTWISNSGKAKVIMGNLKQKNL